MSFDEEFLRHSPVTMIGYFQFYQVNLLGYSYPLILISQDCVSQV